MDVNDKFDFVRGDKVWIRDYPLGRPLNVHGKVVGCLSNDYYNVLIESGLQEGKIVRYKSWSLMKENERQGT